MNKNRAFTLIEVLVVIVILGGLLCLSLPSVRTARTAANRNACQNNMKVIALGLLMYADRRGEFPSAYTTDEGGMPLHSWRTLVLPDVHEFELFKKIDYKKPWDDPINAEFTKARVVGFECPGSALEGPLTTYLAVLGPTSCLRATEPRKVSDLPSNGSKALMLMEVDEEYAVPWMTPKDADEKRFLDAPKSMRPIHSGGFNAVFADGHSQFIGLDTPPEELRPMLVLPVKNQAEAAVAR